MASNIVYLYRNCINGKRYGKYYKDIDRTDAPIYEMEGKARKRYIKNVK